ncbi:MAG: hypothetical protein P8Y44_12800 [Acidobacteriota bacterium]
MKAQTARSRGKAGQIRSARRGFSIFEFLVIFAVTMALVAAGLPAFLQWTKRAQILSFVRATQTRLQVARTEAVKGQFPVVVQPDLDREEILIFANVDNDPTYSFDPDPTQVHRTADYEIARLKVPTQRNIYLWNPLDAGPNGANAITFPVPPGGSGEKAVFLPNGSILDIGGIQVGDSRGNYFSIRVEPESPCIWNHYHTGRGRFCRSWLHDEGPGYWKNRAKRPSSVS